jgi:cell wall-associated NlpC family hydrolase
VANADVAWVDVLPTLQKFTPELKKALGGVMPKAGQQAGEEYARGFTQSAVSGVEAASRQLAAARKKEADAAGAVRVAEAKLQDLRARGKATAGQLVAAEENLAKAKRNLDTQTDAVTRSTQQLTVAEQQAARGAKQLDDGLDRAGKSTGRLRAAVGGLGTGLKTGLGFLLGGGIVAGLGSLFSAADESAKIGRLTENAIRATGGAAKVTAEQVGDLAEAISNKTGVDDEAIQSGENLLLTFRNIRNEAGKGNDVFNQATGLVNDMSVAMGTDLNSAALTVGKALNDPIKGITALGRAGVQFTEQQKDQIRTLVESGHTLEAQKIILRELAGEFGGAAEAAGTPFDKLKVTLGNVAEEVGGFLIPVISGAANFIMDDLIPAVRDGAEWAGDHFGPAIHVAGEALGFIVDVGKSAVDFFGDLPGPIQAGAVALGAWLLLRGPLDSFFSFVAVKITGTATSIGLATTSIGGFRAAAGGLLGLLGGPVGLAIAGVAVAIGFLTSQTEDNSEATDQAARSQGELAQALEQSKGAIDANVRAAAAKEAADKGILDVADQLGIPLSLVTDAILGQGDALGVVGAKLVAYRDANTDIGTGERNPLAVSANEAWTQLQQLAGQTPANITAAQQLAQATSETGAATADAAVTQDQLQTELEETATAASEAKQQTDLLKQSLDILTGAHVSMIEAESAYQAAVDASSAAAEGLNGVIVDQNGNFNLNNESARKVSDVLLGVKDSGNQLIATMIQQGATAQQVIEKDRQLREGFIQSALTMGLSREAAEKLADQILGIPAERETKITADTSQANAAAAEVQRRINELKGREVVIAARTAISASLSGLNGFNTGGGYEGGGYTGPGPRKKPAGVVHAGEVVFSQDDVAAHGGVGAVEAYRRSRPRGYAGGGVVTPNGAPIAVSLRFDPSQYDREMDAAASRLAKSLEPAGRMVAALSFAKSQVGRPYIWGGVGPSGYDCSGFMSALTNVIRGHSPYSRLGSTATFPWPGFAPGYGAFSIGSTSNAYGSGIGHMAGTLLGVNVESTGGVGVRVGGSARGASDGLFGEHGHLVFDRGGLWPPGWGFNGTGDVERVLTPAQDQYFRRFVETADRLQMGGPSQLTGELYLSSGEFLGVVRGVVREDRRRQERDARSAR